MGLNILLDCDGVLGDFHEAAFRMHDVPFVESEINTWNFYEEWGLSATKFWRKCEGHDFWAREIKPYPWAVRLYEQLRNIGDVTIVTSPSNDTKCASGKASWLSHHLGIRPMDCMIGKKKWLMAQPGSVLIDDYIVNLENFHEKCPKADTILFPRPWNNSPHKDWEDVVRRVEELALFAGV